MNELQRTSTRIEEAAARLSDPNDVYLWSEQLQYLNEEVAEALSRATSKQLAAAPAAGGAGPAGGVAAPPSLERNTAASPANVFATTASASPGGLFSGMSTLTPSPVAGVPKPELHRPAATLGMAQGGAGLFSGLSTISPQQAFTPPAASTPPAALKQFPLQPQTVSPSAVPDIFILSPLPSGSDAASGPSANGHALSETRFGGVMSEAGARDDSLLSPASPSRLGPPPAASLGPGLDAEGAFGSPAHVLSSHDAAPSAAPVQAAQPVSGAEGLQSTPAQAADIHGLLPPSLQPAGASAPDSGAGSTAVVKKKKKTVRIGFGREEDGQDGQESLPPAAPPAPRPAPPSPPALVPAHAAASPPPPPLVAATAVSVLPSLDFGGLTVVRPQIGTESAQLQPPLSEPAAAAAPREHQHQPLLQLASGGDGGGALLSAAATQSAGQSASLVDWSAPPPAGAAAAASAAEAAPASAAGALSLEEDGEFDAAPAELRAEQLDLLGAAAASDAVGQPAPVAQGGGPATSQAAAEYYWTASNGNGFHPQARGCGALLRPAGWTARLLRLTAPRGATGGRYGCPEQHSAAWWRGRDGHLRRDSAG